MTLSFVLVGFSMSMPAIAASKKVTFTLNKFKMDPQLTSRRVLSGKGVVDLKAKKIEIVLNVVHVCPPGMSCATVVPPPLAIKVPLLKVTRDDCGGVTYKGHLDRRPVDGALEDVTVKDNTHFHCPTLVALPRFEVIYKTSSYRWKSPNQVHTHSTMTGEKP